MPVSLQTINQSLQVGVAFISFIDYLCDKVEIFPVRTRIINNHDILKFIYNRTSKYSYMHIYAFHLSD